MNRLSHTPSQRPPGNGRGLSFPARSLAVDQKREQLPLEGEA